MTFARQPLSEMLMKFPISPTGKYGFVDDGKGHSLVAQALLLGERNEHDVKRHNITFDPNRHGARSKNLQENIESICTFCNLDPATLAPLDHGKKGVVFSLGNSHVIRMQLGVTPQRPQNPYILQPLHYSYDKNLDVTIEVLDKLETDSLTDNDAHDLRALVQENGISFWDVTRANIGLHPTTGKIIILDPDSFTPIKPTPKKNVL